MNRIIITGGPGFGKSSIIDELEKRGYNVFHEVSREIIEVQKKSGGDAVPWKDHHAFNEAVFKGRLEHFHAATNGHKLYFFDRGLPDSLAYLKADENDVPDHFITEVKLNAYYHRVFYTPYWEDIYKKDAQRWEELEYVKKVDANLRMFYTELGYELVEIPKTDISSRVDFILSELKHNFSDYLK